MERLVAADIDAAGAGSRLPPAKVYRHSGSFCFVHPAVAAFSLFGVQAGERIGIDPKCINHIHMKHTAQIKIMPLKELLDPQGKAVTESLHNLGLTTIDNVRIGKHITLTVEAGSDKEARALIEEACKKLLANTVMESYEYSIEAGA